MQTTALSEGLSNEQDQPPTLKLPVSRRSIHPHKLRTTATQSAQTLPFFFLCVFTLCLLFVL